MKSIHRSVAALFACCGCAMAAAQTVEFRIVERTGQTAIVSTSDNQLDMAVQARVVGGSGLDALGGFGFDIIIHNEHDTFGTLAKLRISNADGTYFTGAATTNATVGSGGLARTFTYLAGINAAFNGQINTSAGTFTNQPGQQEIGLIAGSATGTALLGTPGIDPDSEGNPATWSGYGSGNPPNSGNTATLDPAIAGPYFATGQFIDIYRFRYTATTLTTRTLQFDLRFAAAQTFTQFLYNNGSWGGQNSTLPVGSISITPASIAIALADSGACCDPTGPCTITTGVGCTGSFFLATCTPDPCPPLGSCCATSGACLTVVQANCTGVWTAAGACMPNPCPQPGACCALNENCTLRLQTSCTGVIWYAGTCSPSPCSTPGACCGATCQLVGPASCGSGSVWMPGTCTPNPCPPRIACCNVVTGACTLVTPSGDVVYTYNYTVGAPNYFRNDTGGTVQTITATYNATTKRFLFDAFLSGATSSDPAATTGFWLVISNGPNPKAHPGELAIFYFDASNLASPLLTVYGFNGADANNSWSDGDPATPGDQPGDLIKGIYETSYINAILAEDTLVSGQPRRHVRFDVDASDIISHTPLYPVQGSWYGCRFDTNLGLWLHPVNGFAATYEPNISPNRGHLASLAFTGEGWLDASSRPTTDTDPCPSGWVANVDGACSPTNLCLQRRACCSAGGICLVVQPRDDCPTNYAPASPATSSCSPNPCPSFALQPSGACCNTMTRICAILPQGACDTASHTHAWTGGGGCNAELCTPVQGACCNVVVGNCTVCDQASCGPAAHDWFAGRSCTPEGCAVPGICCDSAGTCRRFTQSRCLSGGSWSPTGTCSPNPCSLSGACCNVVVGTCQMTPVSTCGPAAHDWMPGLTCAPLPCATPGICCDFAAGTCRRLTRTRCPVGSAWSEQRVCTPNPCTGPGSCCNPTTSVCQATYLNGCNPAASDWTLGGACSPSPCAQIGACCEPASGACAPLTRARCDSMKIWLEATPCSPNPCFMPQGACCNVTAGTCTLRIQSECGVASNDWIAAATCTPGACEAPSACCDTSGTCCRVTPTRCASIEGTWLDAQTCTPNPCSPSFATSCAADFDRSGRLDVGDTFLYLEAWFAHEPSADFNSGGLVDVADLLEFLSAWLAGCPNYTPILPNPGRGGDARDADTSTGPALGIPGDAGAGSRVLPQPAQLQR